MPRKRIVGGVSLLPFFIRASSFKRIVTTGNGTGTKNVLNVVTNGNGTGTKNVLNGTGSVRFGLSLVSSLLSTALLL